jgi:hypothetical protein
MKPLIPLLMATGVAVAASTGASAQQTLLSKHCDTRQPTVDILLVDHTEKYDDVDQQRFAGGMNRVFADLRPGRRFEVYLIKENANALAPVFSACVPGCIEDIEAGESNWSTTCSSLRTQQDKRSFQGAFVQIMRNLVGSSTTAEGTAILETLGQLGVQYRDARESIARITIFSDMLEFSSQNKAINGFDEEKADRLLHRSKAIVSERSPFEATSIVVFGIGKRLGQAELLKEKSKAEAELPLGAANAFRNFWRKFFTEVLEVPENKVVLTLNY